MNAHTPTPTKRAPYVAHKDSPLGATYIRQNGKDIFETIRVGHAEFAVTAMNAHDALAARVAELEAALANVIPLADRATDTMTSDDCLAMRRARAALKGQG